MLNHKRKRLLCSITKERDFYAQSQKKETSMLNHKRKRLLCSITKERDFTKQLQRIEKSFDYLIYNQRYSQNNTNRRDSVFLDT